MAAIQLAVSCRELKLCLPLCPDTKWKIHVGKQGYVLSLF